MFLIGPSSTRNPYVHSVIPPTNIYGATAVCQELFQTPGIQPSMEQTSSLLSGADVLINTHFHTYVS